MAKDEGLPSWQARYVNRTANPRVSHSDYQRAARFYRDGLAIGLPPANSGSGKRSAISYAAQKLGLHPQTVRQRLYWASFYGDSLPGIQDYQDEPIREVRPQPELVMPDLPPLDLDGEEYVHRAIQEYQRRREAEVARRWMEFEIKGDKPFAIAYIGDPHLDDPHTDLPRLKADIDIIKRTPRMWAVGLGDYVNGWVGRLQKKYADQMVTERGAYAMAKWLFDQDIWMMLILGNHCAWHGGHSPFNWMMDANPTPLLEWEARFRIKCGDKDWSIWAAHDFPGNSQWNILHGPLKRAMMTGAVADMFICGDKHSYGVLHTQHEFTGRPYWVCRARGYKMQDDYSRQCGFGEHDIGHTVVAVHDPRTGKLQCFDDVEVGAQYLNFLLAR